MARLEARRKKIGYVDTVCIEGDPSAATVVLLHGYGADAGDLASLAGVLQAPKGTNWIFPNGHLTIPLGDHHEGRGWFPISLSELERSAAGGTPIDLSTIIPPGLKKARGLILDMLSKLGTPMNQIILGGFSQGGMLATDVTIQLAAQAKTPPLGLAILSGTLINVDEWTQLAPELKGFEFFQSHGERDTVLGFPMARRLEALLKDSGWVGKLNSFGGGHEIPPEIIMQLGAYIRRRDLQRG